MASHEQSLKEERRQALVDSLLLAEDEAAFLHDAGVSEPRSGDAVSRVHTVTRCQYRLASILNSRVMQLVMIAVIMLSVLLGMLALATELLAPPPHEAPRPPPPTDDPTLAITTRPEGRGRTNIGRVSRVLPGGQCGVTLTCSCAAGR